MGETLDGARRLAVEALSLHIDGMMQDGEAIPEASTPDALANDPARNGAAVFLMSIDVAKKVSRYQITARKKPIEEEEIDMPARLGRIPVAPAIPDFPG